ncbi:MAG TPA: zinc-ribbon domain-containing protein [Gemmatimonadaceae bacterium]
MNVSCPECRSVFRLDPAKITSVSMRARCSICGGLIPVGAAVTWGDEPATAAAQATVTVSPPAAKPVLKTTRTPASAGAAWPPPVPRSTATAPQAEPRVSRQAKPSPPPTAAPLPNNQGTTGRQRTPPFSPKFTPQVPREHGATTANSLSPASGAASLPAAGTFGAPLTPPSRTAIPESPAPKAPAPPASLSAGGSVSAAFSTPSTPAPSPAVVQRKPINPFLANDPNQKARRLARALVSDMVAYHPAKREEGLQGGTLKQLFRDEIKKSYEEYVEQVGREFAESTAHFQEALNDVLAGGRKIF